MKKILVVDDEEILVKLCTTVLTMKGYQVLSATDGRRAVELAQEAHPDLIVMDVNLPEMDGLGAAFLIRSAGETREIPIMAITGACAAKMRDEAVGLGCVDILQKPFTISELYAAIERILTARRAQAG